MKHVTTDKLLSLGMALHADKRMMEHRVRSIFARRHSAWFASLAAVVLCGVIGVLGFTTACQPVMEETVAEEPMQSTGQSTPTSASAEKILDAKRPEPTVTDTVLADYAHRIEFLTAFSVAEDAGYSIHAAEPRKFSDADVRKMIDALQPDAALLSVPQGGSSAIFSFDGIADDEMYRAYFENSDGLYGMIYGTRNGNDFCYLRDSEFSCYREDILLPDLPEDAALLADYEGDFPISAEEVLPQAEALLEAFSLSDMQLIDTEKLCTYKDGQLISKGWDFIFTHGSMGLPDIFTFEQVLRGGEYGSSPALSSPWGQEAALISVDEQGIVCADLRNIVRVGEVLEESVSLAFADDIKAIVTENLIQTHRSALTKEESAIARIDVTDAVLCSALVQDPDNRAAGCYLPAWRVQYALVREDASASPIRYSRYYSAIDGSYIEPRTTVG